MSGDSTADEMSSGSQTLDRGLKILDVIAAAPRPLSIAEVAVEVGLHRSVVYRLLRTLEDRRLVVRDEAGTLRIGPHIASLARSVALDLQGAAGPVLRSVADDLGMTAFLVVLDGAEVVTLLTSEPRMAVASIAQRPGSRHSVSVGAPGIAIQTLLTAPERVGRGLSEQESDDVARARRVGTATSSSEVIPGVTSVAAPIFGTFPAALAVLFVATDDVDAVRARVSLAAAEIGSTAR